MSYASDKRDIAERLALGLRNERYHVFFDREALPAGESYDDRIRKAIGRSHLFVFLASESSLIQGSYPQTELAMARRRWAHPAGKILPVLLDDLSIDRLPPYLRAVSILEPGGDLVADALDAVRRLSRQRRMVVAVRAMSFAALVLVVSLIGWRWWASDRHVTVEAVQVVAMPGDLSDDEPRFRFSMTFRNPGSEAITIVGLHPEAKSDVVAFSGASSEWLNLNPGEKANMSFVTSLKRASISERFRWRLCWSYVRTEDKYYELDSKKVNIYRFMERYRKQECGRWRDWTQADRGY